MKLYKNTPDLYIYASLITFYGAILFLWMILAYDIRNKIFDIKLALLEFAVIIIGFLFARMRETKRIKIL
jgi:hypothetical protein